MGLNVRFYRKECVGFFGDERFFLTYFDVENSKNGCDLSLKKEDFVDFVDDLNCELMRYKNYRNNGLDTEIEPINPKLRVPFDGPKSYTNDYWTRLSIVHFWANGLLKTFDWSKSELRFSC